MQRHHEPSDRKLEWLRGRGVVPVSRALVAAVIMGAGIISAGAVTGGFVDAWRRLAGRAFGARVHTVAEAVSIMRAGLEIAGFVIAAVGLAVAAGWLLSHFVQVGLPERGSGRPGGDDPGYYSQADTSRVDAAARALTSLLVIGAAVVAAIHSAAAIGSAAGSGGYGLLEAAVRPAAIIFLPALVGALILDCLWCRYSHTVSARMTEQEKRREAQESGPSRITEHRRSQRFRERSS